MKHIVFVLFLLIPAFAFSQFGLNAPNRGLTELGKQTSARGLTYLGSGMPNTVIKWRVAKDTACYTWIDTLTSLEYKWNHTGDYWATQGIISKTTPPLATQTSGPATVDNREALWRSTANNVIHGYDRNQSAWIPLHVLRLSAAPSNISSSGSQGAAIYTGGLWKSTVDDSMRHYIAGAWRVISGGGSTYTAGTGIAISGSNVITNTGDLSSTNELNTGFDISGGNLRITDAGATRTVPITSIAPDQSTTNEIQQIDTFRVNGSNLELSLSQDGQPAKTLAVSSIAPVQAVSAGTGISISGTTTRTITNSAPDQTVSITGAGINSVTGTYPNFTVTGTEVDGSTTNEIQSLSLSGQSLGITSGTGVTLPIVDVVAGTGVTVSKASGAATVNSSGITALTGDVTASGPGSAAATIASGAVTGAKLASMGATSGQVLKYNGSAWGPGTDNSGWGLTGNSATAGSNFLGTTNNVSLRLKANNIEGLRIDSLGNVQIGGIAQPTQANRLTVGNPAFTGPGAFINHVANNTTVYGGGPGTDNITFGPSNRLFINTSQLVVPSGNSLAVGSNSAAGTLVTVTNSIARSIDFYNIGVTSTGAFDCTAGALKCHGSYYNVTGARSAGANNLTNIGMYASATNGQLNYAGIFDQGNVGIGITAPTAKLHVIGSGATSATWTAQFHNSTGTNNALMVRDDGTVAMGTNAPSSSALLDISSTTKGFLPPRMTATQASAIASPAEGLMVYVTNTNGTFTSKGWWGYNGATWEKLNN